MTSLIEPTFNMFPSHHDSDEYAHHTGYNANSAPMGLSVPHNVYPLPSTMGYDQGLYTEAPHYMNNSPGLYHEDGELRIPSSSLSSASAPSSATGSPRSNPSHGAAQEWTTPSISIHPSIVGNDYITNAEYSGYTGGHMEELAFDFNPGPAKGFVNPLMIHPEFSRLPLGVPHYEAHQYHQVPHHFPTSPSAAASSPQLHGLRTHSSSPSFVQNGPYHHHQIPFPNSPYAAPAHHAGRRPSMGSFVSPTPAEYHSGDETKEKQRCTYPDCGKIFKDLKAHMLTHQTERPEKCPIQTCEYHVKGFARKYDKNRHTLTHYKGTMVCGFCPGSGSPAEKSFNRADVFKRHLTAVHGVEQTPPNSRKKTPTGANNGKLLSGYAPDATGKCSTCSQTFTNAQDFYEHLDDCVLRIVQQEDPSEAINAQCMAEVQDDDNVKETMELNNLPHHTLLEDEDIDEDNEDFDIQDAENRLTYKSSSHKKKGNPANGVQKSRGMTHSRGGVVLSKNKRRRNQDLPDAWGRHQVKQLKKRVLCVFDGPRRLAKDDMMLAADQEVRIKLADGESYVTDLDVQTLKRAEGFLNATSAEKGPWISDDPTDAQKQDMLDRQRAKDAQALRELEESLTVK